MIKRTIIIVCTAGVLAVAGFGCHTAQGFGQDVENAGEQVQDMAQ